MAAKKHPTYHTPESLQNQIQKYFDTVKADKDKITITGLCLFLGYASRQSFYDLENNPKLSYTIKRARMMIENVYEKQLQGSNVTGAIFALKNFGWEDRQRLDQTITDNRMTISVHDKAKAKRLEQLN